MMEKGYVYFISYAHSKGFGTLEATFDEKLTHIDDIEALAQQIEDELPVEGAVILNFKIIREVL